MLSKGLSRVPCPAPLPLPPAPWTPTTPPTHSYQIAYFSPCRMSNLRKAHVTCRYLLRPISHVAKAHVNRFNLKKHPFFAWSILGVSTHTPATGTSMGASSGRPRLLTLLRQIGRENVCSDQRSLMDLQTADRLSEDRSDARLSSQSVLTDSTCARFSLDWFSNKVLHAQ